MTQQEQPPHAVVPAHNHCEGGAQHDANHGNEGGIDGGGLEVGGCQCLWQRSEKALCVAPLSGVSSPRRSLPGGHILNLDSEVNHRDVHMGDELVCP